MDPSSATLEHLLRKAGYRLEVTLVPTRPAASHMLDDVPRILSLSPEERLREAGRAARFVAAARRA